MLSDNHARAGTFGLNSYLSFDFPVACKTGTSSNYRDNWTFGFTPEFTVGVWVGNPDNSANARDYRCDRGRADLSRNYGEAPGSLREPAGITSRPGLSIATLIRSPGTGYLPISRVRFKKSMPFHLNLAARRITTLPAESVYRKSIKPGWRAIRTL